MVTVDSGPDGVTNASTLEKAAHAFVKTYMSTGGNVAKAVDAANKVIRLDRGPQEENVGDKVVVSQVN